MSFHTGGAARIVYLGTPEIAVAPLKALVAAGHDVALVVTNADRRRGRGKDLMPTPVKAAAVELGIAVSHDLDDVLEVDADFGVVVAYGHIIGSEILDRLPLVNIHFSLLPRWRGAAPLERAILAGDDETGVCQMRIVEALDAGPVFARRTVSIGDSTLDELRLALVDASCELLVDTMASGFADPEPQQGEPVYARKIKPHEHELDFARPAAELLRVIRLGRAFTTLAGKRLRINQARLEAAPAGEAPSRAPGSLVGLTVATGDGLIELETVQPEGKRAVAADEWLRGARLADEVVLGE